jgi:4,5-dihydroxyphthalate decarboxylase
LPASIRIEFLRGSTTLEDMLAAGELDALFSLYLPGSFLRGEPHIVRLFPGHKRVEQDYFRRTGIFPIMHTVVIREDVHRAHPWVAKSLYAAFCAARDIAVDGLYDTDALHLTLPFLIDHVEETRRVFGNDFWSYGLAPNRPTLAAIGHYVHEQHLSPRVVAAEEIFPSDVV